MFTRKHFVAVANTLRSQLASAGGVNAGDQVIKVWLGVATEMRDMFAESNPRFDADAFNNASGITSVEYFQAAS